MKTRIMLEAVTMKDAMEFYDQLKSCLIGGAGLVESDKYVMAYLMDDISRKIKPVALFMYEEHETYVDDVCIVRLDTQPLFMLACRKMFSFWRRNFDMIRIPVAKDSPIVQWCDKLYERIGEDEDSIFFDGCRLVRKRRN